MTINRKRGRPSASERLATEDSLNLLVDSSDRSARRKSAKRIIEASLQDSTDEEVNDIAHDIWDDGIGDGDDGEENDEEAIQPETPSKSGRRRKTGNEGRTRYRKHSDPSPSQDHLPPHERYFWDNKPGRIQTSDNRLPPNFLLNHEEYFAQRESHQDPHEGDKRFLLALHESAFEQWAFELRNEFNLCLYGFGSKRDIIYSFADYLYRSSSSPRIVVVNGYAPNTSLTAILTTIAKTLFPTHIKLPTVPNQLLSLITENLTESPPEEAIHIMINSIDSSQLRKPSIQNILSQLAYHEFIRLIATVDTPNFELLWDVSLRGRFRFLFHDCTTFQSFDAEMDVVESVNELLGRSGRRLGGKDGVGYVLRSLPENARALYRILVAEQLASGIEDDAVAGAEEANTRDVASSQGIEYRVLYHKTREELVCSTDHQLRTLLKEFYDHQMIGTERLYVPFRNEELQMLLEELVE